MPAHDDLAATQRWLEATGRVSCEVTRQCCEALYQLQSGLAV